MLAQSSILVAVIALASSGQSILGLREGLSFRKRTNLPFLAPLALAQVTSTSYLPNIVSGVGQCTSECQAFETGINSCVNVPNVTNTELAQCSCATTFLNNLQSCAACEDKNNSNTYGSGNYTAFCGQCVTVQYQPASFCSKVAITSGAPGGGASATAGGGAGSSASAPAGTGSAAGGSGNSASAAGGSRSISAPSASAPAATIASGAGSVVVGLGGFALTAFAMLL